MISAISYYLNFCRGFWSRKTGLEKGLLVCVGIGFISAIVVAGCLYKIGYNKGKDKNTAGKSNIQFLLNVLIRLLNPNMHTIIKSF